MPPESCIEGHEWPLAEQCTKVDMPLLSEYGNCFCQRACPEPLALKGLWCHYTTHRTEYYRDLADAGLAPQEPNMTNGVVVYLHENMPLLSLPPVPIHIDTKDVHFPAEQLCAFLVGQCWTLPHRYRLHARSHLPCLRTLWDL